MKIPMEQFQRELLRLYRADPSRYTPFALWKMQKMTAEGEAFSLPQGGCCYAIRGRQLLFYTSADGRCHIPAAELNALDMVVLNSAIFDTVKSQLEGFNLYSSWTLFYDFSYRVPQRPSSQYDALDFDFSDERHFQLAAEMINGGGSGPFHPARIRKWTAFPAFDPSLWLFVRDLAAQKLVGVGISTFHREAKETDLDWIYVLPEYQGKGVGRFLIEEIIRRSAPRSRVIRVSGEDAFYKKCGFYEKECWGLAIKPGFSLNEQ